ncbi:hypothetical protein TUN199_02222 [Pyrenophora tritici-repentis]|nr:hypothetical protein Alg130_00890 [Pyrenophora tritici-repentis]KAI0614705.1 hypothetical protein TUN205_01095 [Pyrenophora tritici-repentis]KAI0625737.1 hypothetical protein TUN199_02222 [Pyrenophora tritici-repentis]
MSTLGHGTRRQPERIAKTQAAREQMSTRTLQKGVLGATPNSHYLAIAQKNVETSMLLCLPAEIRNRIWTHVVSVDKVYIGKVFYDEPIDEYPEASILRVCRQIHAEICLMAYTVNVFWFYEHAPFKAWLKRRLPAQKAAVRRIQIFCNGWEKSPLRSFTRLESVTVSCVCDGSHGTKTDVRSCPTPKEIFQAIPKQGIIPNALLKVFIARIMHDVKHFFATVRMTVRDIRNRIFYPRKVHYLANGLMDATPLSPTEIALYVLAPLAHNPLPTHLS